MEEESDFSKLSIEERCQHKSWKARVSGYTEAAKLFGEQDDEKSPVFQKYLGLIKKFVLDSNAIAQEKGLETVLVFVENAACAPKTVNCVMSGLVNKCFSSSREKTRKLALEIALMYIEIEKQDVVSEELVKGLKNKLPKVVCACIIALREALHLFGSQVVLVKPLVKELPKLLEDRDKSVRDESKQLCAEIYRWVGESFKYLLQNLKPVKLTELDNEFQKHAEERIAPTRYLKSQKKKNDKRNDNEEGCENNSEEGLAPPPQVDAFDLMTAVDILSKLPKNFYEQCKAKKWEERKKVLETLLQMTTPNVKLDSGDYGELVSALKKCITKDSNVVVVALAIKCLTSIVMGLRNKFQPYASACIPAIFQKFKEKKHNVVDALRECTKALYSISTFDVMLEDIKASLNSKNPHVKAETCAFLTTAFAICPASQLNKKLLKALTESLLKTLNDTDAIVRKKAFEAMGTVLKVVGERVMTQFLQQVEAIKLTKIREYCDKAGVQPQVSVEKKPEPISAKPVQEKNVPKPRNKAKKSASADLSKSKVGSSPAGGTRFGATKKESTDAGESEFKELDLSEEDVLTQASQILTEDVINGLGSSDWKDRLIASKKFFEKIQAMEKSTLPTQCLVKVLAKKPGFKDNNFQILKLRFEILAYIADNAQISHVTVQNCLSDIVDRIGDSKYGTYCGLLLTSLVRATSLEYISIEVLSLAFNQKNQKNLSESLIWLSTAIKEFALKVNLKEVVDYLKKGFSFTNPTVRNAALTLVGTIYLYVGKSLRMFFENEKPAVLQQIDSEFEKMKDAKPTAPEKGNDATADKADGSSDAPKNDILSVGLLTDQHLSLLEERIERTSNTSKTRTIKPVESNLPSAKASSPVLLHSSYTVSEENTKIAKSTTSTFRRSGPFKLETEDTKQIFRRKEPEIQLLGLVQVNADEILNLPDIQLPSTRRRPLAASLKILNSTDNVDMCMNIAMFQFGVQDIPIVIKAFAQIEEVLKSEQALTVLDSRVDQLLIMGTMQYRYAHKHMTNETISKADVVKLYRGVTLALVALFENPVLSQKASRDVLRDLVPYLITLMLDNRLHDLQEGDHVVKIVNLLIMRILQKGNPTHVFSALIKLLYASVSVNVSDGFTNLVMKCLWKMIKMIHLVIHEMNIDRILLDIHIFLKTYPFFSWKEREDDTPIRTIKTILFKLVEIKNEDIMEHLSLVYDRQESDLANYLHKLLAKRKNDNRKPSNKNPVAIDNDANIRHKHCKSLPSKVSKSTPEALTEIFRKIGCKEQTIEGLAELYDFTQNHPEVDIEPYLKNSSELFQNYIRLGIQQLEEEKGSRSSNQASSFVTSLNTEESIGWNSNISYKNISFTKDKLISQFWGENFPPVPPCTVDTTPMDLVEWLKNVVARLGMDNTKYDDLSFLDKVTSNGNNGPLSEEELSIKVFDIDRYIKIIDDLRNAT